MRKSAIILAILGIVLIASLPFASATIGNLSNGVLICQAHYNTGDMGPYNEPYTTNGLSSSGVPNIDNCYLPAEIFRGYTRWDANGGYFDLRSTPYLSFDLWVDHVMQIEVGLVDTTDGGWVGGYSTLIADTYHNGQINTPPYDDLYGVSLTTSADGWLIMNGPADRSLTHYVVDMRTLGCSLAHIGQIAFSFTCGHQSSMNWRIYNVEVSSQAVPSTPAPTATPTYYIAPTIAPVGTYAPYPTSTPFETVEPVESGFRISAPVVLMACFGVLAGLVGGFIFWPSEKPRRKRRK